MKLVIFLIALSIHYGSCVLNARLSGPFPNERKPGDLGIEERTEFNILYILILTIQSTILYAVDFFYFSKALGQRHRLGTVKGIQRIKAVDQIRQVLSLF